MSENENADQRSGEEFVGLVHHGDPEKRKQTLFRLVEKLIDLERSTSPLVGETANNKGRNAWAALETAENLVRLGAGWAIDHFVGTALRGLEFVPAPPPRTRDHPVYLELIEQVDDHELERDGANLRHKHVELDPAVARAVLYNLLRANPGAFPDRLRHSFMEALKALDYGEVLPLLAPSPNAKNRKVRYRQRQLELWALALVRYREVGRGMNRLQARNDVGFAYGVDAETVRKWGPSLRAELGALEVARVVERAHNRATFAARARQTRVPVDPSIDELYGDAALEDAGQRYQSLKEKNA